MVASDELSGVPITQVRAVPISLDDKRWAAFVDSVPQALIFHHPIWSQALKEEYGRTPFAIAAENADRGLVGILPLLDTRGLPFNVGEHATRQRLVSLPRTPVAGPLSANPEVSSLLLQAAVELAAKREVTLQVKAPWNNLEEGVSGMVAVPWKQSYILELPSNTQELRFGNARKMHRIKWAVTKAVKAGVTTRWAHTEEELQRWYELYLLTMRWHCCLPRPYRFFVSLWRHLHSSGRMRLLVAELRNNGVSQILSGCIYLAYGQRFYCWLNGRKREMLAFHPNDALHWEAITQAWKEGFRFYDFGEVEEEQVGLMEFKSKWGAEPNRGYRYYYPRACKVSAPAPHSTDIVRSVTTSLWRRIPPRVTASMGDLIYGYL